MPREAKRFLCFSSGLHHSRLLHQNGSADEAVRTEEVLRERVENIGQGDTVSVDGVEIALTRTLVIDASDVTMAGVKGETVIHCPPPGTDSAVRIRCVGLLAPTAR